MVNRKVVLFDEFYYQLKLMYLFQKHPVCDIYRSRPQLLELLEHFLIDQNNFKYRVEHRITVTKHPQKHSRKDQQ
jgi:hypothetical protein